MNLSYWEKSSFLTDADYVIVGAGIVGLFAALTIRKEQPSARIVVLERSFLPDGASTKNAGFACFGSISELIEQEKAGTQAEFLTLITQRWEGLQLLLATLGAEAIGFEPCGGYELFSTSDSDSFESCKSKITYYNDLLKNCIGADAPIFSIADECIDKFQFKGISHLIFNAHEGKIDSGKMMKNLIEKTRALGVEIFFGAEVSSFEKNEDEIKVAGSNFEIATKKLLISTNAFANQLLPNLSIVPGRGQVIITKPIANIPFNSTFHFQKGYFYFRNIDNRILIGGGRNLFFQQEETTEMQNTKNITTVLENILKDTIVPNQSVKIDYAWSGIMSFGENILPIIKQHQAGVYVATRCNGMGVAMGSKSGESLARLAMQPEN